MDIHLLKKRNRGWESYIKLQTKNKQTKKPMIFYLLHKWNVKSRWNNFLAYLKWKQNVQPHRLLYFVYLIHKNPKCKTSCSFGEIRCYAVSWQGAVAHWNLCWLPSNLTATTRFHLRPKSSTLNLVTLLVLVRWCCLMTEINCNSYWLLSLCIFFALLKSKSRKFCALIPSKSKFSCKARFAFSPDEPKTKKILTKENL